MSKTKEDIVRQEYEKYFSCQKYDTSVNRKLNLEYFSPAMDEYAKQVAIDFSEWKDVNCTYNTEWGNFDLKGRIDEGFSNDELFTEFLKQYNQ